MKRTAASWRLWAGAYVATVGVVAVLNQASSPGAVGWYVAGLVLTFPLSWVYFYPIVFVAAWVTTATGGGAVSGNGYGAAVLVASQMTLAVANVVFARALTHGWLSISRRCQRRRASRVASAS